MRMKKWIIAICVAGVFLCACSSQSRWQKQYDLGIQYLIDENYEEAVVAFQAAIEVEPNQAEGYQGIGQAYQGQAQTLIAENSWEEGLEYYRLAVQAYETAAELKSSAENTEDELDDLRAEISKLEDEIELLEILNTNQVEGNAQDYLGLIESVRQCCSAEDYDQVYELMQGETFLTLRNFCTKQKPLIVMGEDGIGLGFYVGGFVYYGEYSGQMREGEGVWLRIISDDQIEQQYLAQGSWESDMPNGQFEVSIIDKQQDSRNKTVGTVINGLWDGPAQEIGNDGYIYNVSFTMGKYDVLFTDVTTEGKTEYFISADGHRSRAVLNTEHIHRIEGTGY